ncbi:hypothetical protein, partial [Sansalvadorimonas verongulae]|uniref:hypothetical protein n=1 Tax=Sansalvadorimonas verongulae TaxID=2172824 RepID=UPI0018AD1F5E
EIPMPQAFWRVPVTMLPDPQARGLQSELAIRGEKTEEQDNRYYLAFEFTTHNQDYGCLAWQKDASGSVKKAEEGMARTFHDLGVWSSLGVLHSSTAALLHNFTENREEILLPELFTAPRSVIRAFPGCLSYWDTKATEQSDWGFTGLRDIGDAEFYGTINSMHLWKDSSWQFPTVAQ